MTTDYDNCKCTNPICVEHRTMSMTTHEATLRRMLIVNGVTNPEVLENTPRRFLKFFSDYTIGLREPYVDFKSFPMPDANQMITIESDFFSICEHHLLPYLGKAFISYLPREKVVGVSKMVKLIKHSFRKPSIQEGVTEQIAKTVAKETDAAGVAVTCRGFHLCVAMRYQNGWMTTSTMLGKFNHKDSKFSAFTKQEYLTYIQPRLAEMKL